MNGEHPERIGRYRILGPLGQGAMGMVYRAEQEPLGREVALKVLNASLAAQPGFHERFMREARAAASIVHPNVITCYDSGQDGDTFFMALELATGGDLDVRAGGAVVDEGQAVVWMRDAANGLQAIDDAGLLHRDIKPANIFLDARGQAKIADLGLARMSSGDDTLTQAGAIMGSPAYMSPEQARGAADIDIRSDIYALGASFFKLVCGQVPFSSDSPLGTLQKVINDPLPDPRSLVAGLSEEGAAIIRKAMAKNPAERYQKAAQMREDLDCHLQGVPLHHALDQRVSHARLHVPEAAGGPKASATSTEPPGKQVATKTASGRVERANGSDRQQDRGGAGSGSGDEAKRERSTTSLVDAAKTRAKPMFSKQDLRRLLKRIHMDEQGLTAWINLAPGASFPRPLLEALLEEAEVSYGIDEAAITAATRPSQTPRRLILAQGDKASPGFPGRDIHNEEIPALVVPIVVRVTDDQMMAYALIKPNSLVEVEIAKRVIMESGVRFGIDPVAAKRLYDGPPDPSGRVVVARGRHVVEGVSAGFHLLNDTLNTTIDNLVTQDLSQVYEGDVIAIWHDEVRGKAGMDVFGVRHDPKPLVDRAPDDYVGEGVEISRTPDGQLQLKALRSGLCQQQRDGAIRIVRAHEVRGDLEPGAGPLVTDDLVVIRGTVKEGAQIQSTNDVVILGDLEDANVQCSGSLQVNGVIGSGASTIIAAETVEADGIGVRRVMAGNIAIRGTVRNSELIATGDIEVEEIIGGTLQAGGSISVLRAGDENGTTTELWAGHHLDYEAQSEMAQLAERKLTRERQAMVEQRKEISGELRTLSTRQERLMQAGGFIDRKAAAQMLAHQKQLEEQHRRIADEAEAQRLQLSMRRKTLNELKGLSDNAAARIEVKEVAHKGVVIKLADADPQLLKLRRKGFRMGCEPGDQAG